MAWNAPATAVAGSVLTAAWLNTYLRDNLIALRAGGFALSSQAVNDLMVASSTTQWQRLVGASAAANLQDAALYRPHFVDYSEAYTTPSISGGAVTLNLEAGNAFKVSLTSDVTITFSNPPATGRYGGFTLILVGDGTPRTITWPGTVRWPGGVAPTPTSTNGRADRFIFTTYDAGSNWWGGNGGQNFF